MDKKEIDPSAEEASKLDLEKTPAELLREQRIKQLAQIICICKGINLGRVLKGLPGSESVADVNRKVGTGSGGCCGERCGPKIKALLEKYKNPRK